jgi:hypothetical protein
VTVAAVAFVWFLNYWNLLGLAVKTPLRMTAQQHGYSWHFVKDPST